MSQQAWNTAMMGLCLTVICLVGASASAAFKVETVEKHRELSLIHKDKIHEVITELCSKIPDSFRVLVEGLCNIYHAHFEDRSRLKMQRSDIFENVVDMTILSHVGSCQCETVMFMVEAPRSLKIEPPSVGSDDEALDVNSFPKTIVPQKHFSLIQGKENIRSYQKPFKAKESEYHHALAVYAFSHRSKRDQPLNPNTIQTFCGLCGTQLVWKPHHKKDAHPLLHVNVHCLKSNWIPLPETEHNLVQPKSLPSPKKTVLRDLQQNRNSSGELSTIPSTVPSATSSVRSEQSFSKEEEKKPAYNGSSAMVSPSEEEGFNQSKYDSADGSFSGTESDTIHGPLEQKFHSIVSVEGEEMDRSVCSETTSTVTTSSMSMTSGWRLRDPNGVWNGMGSAPSSGSKISLEHRLSDRDSQDALLFQMRKHLASHTSPRNALPKPMYSDEEESDSQSNSNNEDEMSTAVAKDVPSTPLQSKSQATPMSSTNKTLFGNGTRRRKDGLASTPATTTLIDDDASASVVSSVDNESLGYTPTYEPPSIFFNKLLRPTR